MIERKCKQCRKSFRTDRFNVKRGWGKFCSTNCRNQYQHHRIVVYCSFCQTKLNVVKSKLAKSKKFYCDMNCYLQNAKHRHNISFKCEQCGKTKTIKKSALQRRRTRFCTLNCYYAYRLENQKGYLNENGYITIYRDGEQVLEHRYVMEQKLGRKLRPNETIHHRNGIRSDNRLSNLELRVGAHGYGQSVKDRVKDAVYILKLYGRKHGFSVRKAA